MEVQDREDDNLLLVGLEVDAEGESLEQAAPDRPIDERELQREVRDSLQKLVQRIEELAAKARPFAFVPSRC